MIWNVIMRDHPPYFSESGLRSEVWEDYQLWDKVINFTSTLRIPANLVSGNNCPHSVRTSDPYSADKCKWGMGTSFRMSIPSFVECRWSMQNVAMKMNAIPSCLFCVRSFQELPFLYAQISGSRKGCSVGRARQASATERPLNCILTAHYLGLKT